MKEIIVNNYSPLYTGPLMVAGQTKPAKHEKYQNSQTLEYVSGSNSVILCGLGEVAGTGIISRIRHEMTPEEAKDLAMELLAMAKYASVTTR